MDASMDIPTILSIIALAGTALSALVNWWLGVYSNKAAQKDNIEREEAKYRDYQIHCANQLSSQLVDFIISPQPDVWAVGSEDQRDRLYTYTAYLFGQWLYCTHVLRRQFNYLHSADGQRDYQIDSSHTDLQSEFEGYEPKGDLLRLYVHQQLEIAERMTKRDGTDTSCIGFATFLLPFKDDQNPAFQNCFKPIIAMIDTVLAVPLAQRGKRCTHITTMALKLTELSSLLKGEETWRKKSDGTGGLLQWYVAQRAANDAKAAKEQQEAEAARAREEVEMQNWGIRPDSEMRRRQQSAA